MKKLCCTALVFLLLISMAACQKVEQTPDAPVESEQRKQEDKESEAGVSGADEKAALSEKEDDTLKREFNFETKTVMLNSGYEMPINGIGTYSLQDETCVDAVSEALRRGVRLIDTAYMYHNEESVGQAVRESGIPREEIFVITKLYPNQFSDASAAIEEALQKLDISYIDMMLLHHPGSGDVEAYHAMEKAAEEVGVHFYAPEQFANGYRFQGIYKVESQLEGDKELVLDSFTMLEVRYKKSDNKVILQVSPRPIMFTASKKVYTDTIVNNAVTYYYKEMHNKWVPVDYQPTHMEQKAVEEGRLNIGYGANEPFETDSKSFLWESNGQEYELFCMENDISKEELYEMALEIK